MYSITHYCYWRLQDVWEKAVRKAQDEAIGLLIFHKQSKITNSYLANVKLSAMSPRVPLLCF